MKRYEEDKDSRYKVGFYGGKFIPFHKGHNYCIECASKQCEKVHVILFYGGDQEIAMFKEMSDTEKEEYSLENRLRAVTDSCKKFGNVEVHVVDVTDVKHADGTEDWDGETPLVLAVTGKMDAVYSSEVHYDEYFTHAYPWAEHILVDPPREHYPISGTKIRGMKDKEERERWIL